MPSSHLSEKNHCGFDVKEINDPQNKISKSALGKTSGVFSLVNPAIGKILAVLKPVQETEIFSKPLIQNSGYADTAFCHHRQKSFQ